MENRTDIESTSDPEIRKGLCFAFVGVLAFSLTLPMTTIAVSSFEPLQVAVWRSVWASFAAACVILWDYRRENGTHFVLPGGRQWMLLGICALGVVFGFPVFTTLAMSKVSASHGAVVVGLLPLATAVFGVCVSNERPPLVFWLIAVSGTLLTTVFVVRQSSGTGGAFGIGHVYLFAAVISAGMGYAVGGQLAKSLAGWRVACWSLVVVSPVLYVIAFFVSPIPVLSLSVPLSAFFYLAFVSQLFGFFAWYRGMAIAGIARASQLQLLQLFMTVAAAIILLNEPYDSEVLIFGAAVVVCVALGSRVRFGRQRSK